MSSQVEHNKHESVKMLMQSGSFFLFFLACGDSGYSRHRFSQRKSAAVSGSFLLHLFILFSFPFLSSSHYLFSPVSSVICSKHPSLFFPFSCLCFSSSPLFLCSFFLFGDSFPFCCCPTLSLHQSVSPSPVSCVSVLCSRQR